MRDLMVRGFHTFRDLEHAGERIATNILADRLRRLCRAGIVQAERDPVDGRQKHYRLTEKGIDLAPVMSELLIWGAKREQAGAPPKVNSELARNRVGVLKETRCRWKERDLRPLFPWLSGPQNKIHYREHRAPMSQAPQLLVAWNSAVQFPDSW